MKRKSGYNSLIKGFRWGGCFWSKSMAKKIEMLFMWIRKGWIRRRNVNIKVILGFLNSVIRRRRMSRDLSSWLSSRQRI